MAFGTPILPAFNAGTGDLAAQPAAPPLVLSIDRQVHLCFDTLARTNYQLEYRTALAPANGFHSASPFREPGRAPVSFDAVQGQPQRFYRVRQF